MKLIGSMAIAFSMYSKIPVPQVEWTKERMKYAMCFFPLVGVVIGVCMYLVHLGIITLEISSGGRIGLAVIPLILTGGIHMDGFLDVVDARSSHADREKKLDILKDPHTGAFAIIGCGVYLLVYAAAILELEFRMLPAFCAVFVLTRALSGLSVVSFPKAKNSGLAAAFSSQAQKLAVGITMVAYILLSLGWIGIFGSPVISAFVLLEAAGMYYYYYRMSMKEFGGITGDLAGYFLQMCELFLLIGLIIVPKIV